MLHRARALGELSEAKAAEHRARLLDASAAWHRYRIEEEVVARARQSFPVEPIRSLDAIHLATALSIAGTTPGAVREAHRHGLDRPSLSPLNAR